ncbi:hypothetical protein V6N12_076134 [Hibiscus sabdariffa]|uniref:Uncharacterized protein n=1 Tax=Hibiscus sabdariffa TaxID=183260 RepID=A0ABR2AYA7_9ROSI
MSAFGKAQAKGTRIGFLKWSAQSSERRSGRQVKARKHTTKAQLKVQSKQSEKSRRKQGRFPSDILKARWMPSSRVGACCEFPKTALFQSLNATEGAEVIEWPLERIDLLAFLC